MFGKSLPQAANRSERHVYRCGNVVSRVRGLLAVAFMGLGQVVVPLCAQNLSNVTGSNNPSANCLECEQSNKLSE
jgi:hypothetical protein